MQLSLSTPALLFPAISLLMLAYTNRFLTLAGRVRSLSDSEPDQSEVWQIENMRRRIKYIQLMQMAGALSFLLCTLSMLLLGFEFETAGFWLFSISLLLLMASLFLSVTEIYISADALDLHLQKVIDSHS